MQKIAILRNLFANASAFARGGGVGDYGRFGLKTNVTTLCVGWSRTVVEDLSTSLLQQRQGTGEVPDVAAPAEGGGGKLRERLARFNLPVVGELVGST